MSGLSGWKRDVVGRRVDLINGFAFPSEGFTDGEGVPLIRIRDLDSQTTEVRYAGKYQDRYLIGNGDLLIGMDGDFSTVRWKGGKALLNQRVCKLITKDSSIVDQDFLYYRIIEEIQQIHRVTAATTVKHLSSNDVLGIKLELPSPPEQTKIAEVLSTVDRAIEQTEALIAKQQRIKTGLMQDLLTKGIDEHGNLRSEATHEFKDSPLGRIPVEWDVSLLDSLAHRGSGHTPNKLQPAYWNGGIKWVSLADSRKLDDLFISETDKEISELGLKNSSAVLHSEGTVILSRDAGVGKSAILASEMAVSQHFMAWRCKQNRLNNIYLYYWLQRDKPTFEGIASGSTIVTIGLQFFREYLIAAPYEVDEQERIAEKLKEADFSIKRSRVIEKKLRSLKSALMQDLLTGKKRVTPLLEPTTTG